MNFIIEPAGVDALHIEFDAAPTPALTERLGQLARWLEVSLVEHVVDVTVGWNSLLIQYEMQKIRYATLYVLLKARLTDWLKDAISSRAKETLATPSALVLPVLYDGEDLATVAELCDLASVADVIACHEASPFYVGAIGFAPGFAYLGGLDERLTLPRRSSPRAHVPAGSVAIAAGQSAFYPQASPGGWHLLGRCPLTLFDANQTPASPFHIGQAVRCKAIDQATFETLKGTLPQ